MKQWGLAEVCLEGSLVPLAAWMEKVSPRIVMLLSKTRRLLLAASCSSACKSQMAAWDHAPCPYVAQMARTCTKTRFSVSVGLPHWAPLQKNGVIPDMGQAPSPPALVPLPTLGQDKLKVWGGRTAWKTPDIWWLLVLVGWAPACSPDFIVLPISLDS